MLTDDPIAALPLGYAEQHFGPWASVAQWAARAAVAYAGIAILMTIPNVFFYFFQNSGGIARNPAIRLKAFSLFTAPGAMAAGVLLAGGILFPRRQRVGRLLIIWSCAAIVACEMFQFGFIFLSGSSRSLGVAYIAFSEVSQFFSLLRTSFFPVVLILLFRKREVCETFQTE